MEEKKLNDQDLENAAGGMNTPDEVHNLNNYTYRTVSGLPAGTCLQMQMTPNGPFMSTMYSNGESIYVNKYFVQSGYLLAFKNGIYGYVDGRYVK